MVDHGRPMQIWICFFREAADLYQSDPDDKGTGFHWFSRSFRSFSIANWCCEGAWHVGHSYLLHFATCWPMLYYVATAHFVEYQGRVPTTSCVLQSFAQNGSLSSWTNMKLSRNCIYKSIKKVFFVVYVTVFGCFFGRSLCVLIRGKVQGIVELNIITLILLSKESKVGPVVINRVWRSLSRSTRLRRLMQVCQTCNDASTSSRRRRSRRWNQSFCKFEFCWT